MCYANTDQSKIYPTETAKKVGSKAVFTCQSDKTPDWKWIFHGYAKTPISVKYDKKSIVIKKVEIFHRGYYECEGTYNGEKFKSEAILKVRGNTTMFFFRAVKIIL